MKKRRKVDVKGDNPVFFNVRDAVDDFSGREDILSRLSVQFDDREGSNYVAVICAGGGGMGKTQLILEYGFPNKEKYGPENCERVFWVSAETSDSLKASFKDFAEQIKLF